MTYLRHLWPVLNFHLLTNTWFCRAGGDPVAFPLITATILLYSSICFLGVSQVKTCLRSFSSWSFDSWYFYSGVPIICWVVLRIVQATLLAGIQTMFVLVKLRLYLRPLPNSSMSPFFETFLTTDIFWLVLQDVIQITIKYDKQSFVFDNISRKARCRDLFSLFKERMGSKIPSNARMMGNGRFLRMCETIEEVRVEYSARHS